MKKTTLVIVGIVTASTLCTAQELTLNCEEKHQARSTFFKDNDKITYQPGKGRSGNGFRIVHPADPNNPKAKDIGFHAHGSYRIKVESVSKPVRTRVYLKGKGKGSFGLLAFDKQQKVFYPRGMRKKFELNSPDEWALLEFTYTPEAGSVYSARIGTVLPYISIAPGSDFLLDDWETKFLDENKTIVIED